jgi:hypothetical protein
VAGQDQPRNRSGRSSLQSREHGQALVIVVLFLFVLLGMAAMVIDVG